jgi:hypothetical protein
MTVNIDQLSESELVRLNEKIVQRLRMINQLRAHSRMLDFTLGERVWFQIEGDRIVRGVLVKYNRKSVTVITNDGTRWTVSPRQDLPSVAIFAANKCHCRNPHSLAHEASNSGLSASSNGR